MSDILSAVEFLLLPLNKLKINTKSVGLLIYMTQFFIATLIKEYRAIKSAQIARNINKNFLFLMIPLLLRSFKISEYVTEAITSRNIDENVK